MTFDIISYMSGLTGFVLDKAVLERIAFDRGVDEVEEYSELSDSMKQLLLADILFVAYLSPTVWASSNMSHGSYSKSVGSQTIQDKDGLYDMMKGIYSKYDTDKLDVLENSTGNLQWLDY